MKDFLYNAMTMSEDYNYPLAYYDVYTILYSIDQQDKWTNKLANYYLFLAYEKKAEHAKSTIEERFGQFYSIPKSEEYFSKIESAN